MSAADADLIRLCSQMVAIEETFAATIRAQVTDEDEERDEAVLDALGAEQRRLFDQLPAPATMAGVKALAQAALAMAPQHRNGGALASNMNEWLALTVAEFIATDGRTGRVRTWEDRSDPDRRPIAKERKEIEV